MKQQEKKLEGNSMSISSLWKSRNLRKRTLALYFTWFVSEFEYYGFSLSAGSLGGDFFVNFLTLGAAEFPAYLLSMYLLKKYGRRNPYIFIMILGACVSLAGAFTLGDDSASTTARLVLALLGKFSVTAALGMLYVYSGEIFPTVSLVSALI